MKKPYLRLLSPIRRYATEKLDVVFLSSIELKKDRAYFKQVQGIEAKYFELKEKIQR